MASTFVNDLRLEEIGDGEQSTTWGATTNTNLELVAEAFSFGTEAITTNANTHTTTIADGSTDPGRSIFLKYTGTLDSECTITIGPNTVSKLWFIENATSGSQNIVISQGSGANITIANGQTKVVYSDGAGSGAAIVDALQDLAIPDLFIDDDLTVGDDVLLNSDGAIIKLGADADVTLTHVADTGVTLASGTNATTLQVDSTADNVNAAPKLILNRARSGNTQDGDIGGQIEFKIKNDASGTPEQIDFAKIFTTAVDFTDATEDGKLTLQTITAGAAVNSIETTGTATTLNTITDDANAGPILNLKRTRGSGTAADNDIGGQIEFLMNDAGGNETTVGRIKSKLTTAADGSEDSKISFASTNGGTTTDVMTVSGEGTENAVFPESHISFDLGVNGTRTDGNKNYVLGPGENRLWKCINSATACFGAQGNTESSSAVVYIDFASNAMILNSSIASPSSVTMLAFRTSGNGTSAGGISCSGSTTAFTTSSDYRIKENVVDLTGAIDRVKNLKTYRFNFKDNKSKTVDGFIAHEVSSIVPEAVVGEKDAVDSNGNIDPQAIDQAKLVPILTAALQEAISKIEVLETKVAALEAK